MFCFLSGFLFLSSGTFSFHRMGLWGSGGGIHESGQIGGNWKLRHRLLATLIVTLASCTPWSGMTHRYCPALMPLPQAALVHIFVHVTGPTGTQPSLGFVSLWRRGCFLPQCPAGRLVAPWYNLLDWQTNPSLPIFWDLIRNHRKPENFFQSHLGRPRWSFLDLYSPHPSMNSFLLGPSPRMISGQILQLHSSHGQQTASRSRKWKRPTPHF